MGVGKEYSLSFVCGRNTIYKNINLQKVQFKPTALYTVKEALDHRNGHEEHSHREAYPRNDHDDYGKFYK